MSGAVQGTQQNRPIKTSSSFPSQEPRVPSLRDRVSKLASDVLPFIKIPFSYSYRGFSWAWGEISSLTKSGKNRTDQVKDGKIKEMSGAVQGTQQNKPIRDRVSKLASDVLAFIKIAFGYSYRGFSWAWGEIGSLTGSGKNRTDQVKDGKIKGMSGSVEGTQQNEPIRDRVSKLDSESGENPTDQVKDDKIKGMSGSVEGTQQNEPIRDRVSELDSESGESPTDQVKDDKIKGMSGSVEGTQQNEPIRDRVSELDSESGKNPTDQVKDGKIKGMSGSVEGTQQNEPIKTSSSFVSQEPKVPSLRDRVSKLVSDLLAFIKRAFSYPCRAFSWGWCNASHLASSFLRRIDVVFRGFLQRIGYSRP